ncbi:MAG: alpha/beta hydrolase [Eubacteriales bacterium]|nr:alpha/beta hydrolase [Eubacteriales bacterium]
MNDLIALRKDKAPRVRKIWPRLLAIILVIFFFSLGLLVYSLFDTAKTLMSLPPQEFNPIAGHLMPDYEQVIFQPVASDIQLSGWFFRAAKDVPFRGNIIFVHQVRSNKLEFELESAKFFNFLLERGFNVLAFDQRHSGQSQGDASGYGYAEYRDVQGAMAACYRLSGRKNFIFYGLGTGVTASLLAWEDLPESPSPEDLAEAKDPDALLSREDVKGFILDTPASSAYDYIRLDISDQGFLQKNFYRRYIPDIVRISSSGPDRINLIPLIGHIEVPIMITRNLPDTVLNQATTDTFIKECVRLKSESCYVAEIPQAGHLQGFSLDQDKYLSDLGDFLDLYFSSVTEPEA